MSAHVRFFASAPHRRPRLAHNLAVGFSPTQTSLRSIHRPRLLIEAPTAGGGTPIQVDGLLLQTIFTRTPIEHAVRLRRLPLSVQSLH